MSITTATPHGQMIDGLSRALTLVREHAADLPTDLRVSVTRGIVSICFLEHTADEAARFVAVDALASLLHLDPAEDRYGHYSTHNDTWNVYTASSVKCSSCRQAAVR